MSNSRPQKHDTRRQCWVANFSVTTNTLSAQGQPGRIWGVGCLHRRPRGRRGPGGSTGLRPLCHPPHRWCGLSWHCVRQALLPGPLAPCVRSPLFRRRSSPRLCPRGPVSGLLALVYPGAGGSIKNEVTLDERGPRAAWSPAGRSVPRRPGTLPSSWCPPSQPTHRLQHMWIRERRERQSPAFSARFWAPLPSCPHGPRAELMHRWPLCLPGLLRVVTVTQTPWSSAACWGLAAVCPG